MTRRPAIADGSAAPPPAPVGVAPTPRRLRFGDFEVVPGTGELLRDDRRGSPTPVRLQPQPARLLLYLVQRQGELVTRAELQRHLWGENHFVDHDQGLNYCIRVIRRALDDDASSPRYLETVPRRGYRFRCPVRLIDPDAPRGGSLLRLAPPRAERRGSGGGLRTALIVLAISLSSLGAHWALSAGWVQPTAPPKLAVLPFEDHTGSEAGRALARGLADELISSLAGDDPERLGVIARASSMAYAGRRLTAAQIGAELDADYLLTGGIQSVGETTRISVQLVRVRDETHLWAETYERPLEPGGWGSWVEALGREVAGHLPSRTG